LVQQPNSTVQIDDGSSGGFIQFADTVLIDGTAQPANVTIERNDKIKKEIYVYFPNFQQSAIYDPVVTLSSGATTASGFPAYGIVLIVLGLLSFAGIGFCFYWIKRKAGYETPRSAAK